MDCGPVDSNTKLIFGCIVVIFLQLDEEIEKLKSLKAELGSQGQNWTVDKRLSGGGKEKAGSAPLQDPRVKEQGDLVRKLKSAKVISYPDPLLLLLLPLPTRPPRRRSPRPWPS